MLSVPRINYSEHHAFKHLPRTFLWNCADIECAALEINQRFDEIVARMTPLADAIVSYEKSVLPAFARLAKIAAEHGPGDLRTVEWFCRSLQALPQRLAEELACSNHARAELAPRHAHLAARLSSLQEDGYTCFTFPSASIERWFNSCSAARNTLLERSRQNEGARQWIALPVMGSVARDIESRLMSAGALTLAAAYRGEVMELDHIALHYSHPKQTWYQGCYADEGLVTSDMAYLHNDYEPSMLKLLIYLTPVTKLDGPFSFVRGSHRWARSMLQHLAYKELDRQHPRTFPECSSAHYRPRFALKSERARLLSLPESFQGTSHFGDDVMASDTAHTQLSAAEVAVTGENVAVLFDGARGLHRGALNQVGERWALQLGFRIRPKRSLIRGIARQVYRMASRWAPESKS